MKKIVIVDVCNTLYDSNTTFDFLQYYFKEDRKYVRLQKLRKSIIYRILNRAIFVSTGIDSDKKLFTRLLKGIKQKELNSAINEFFLSLSEKKIQDTHNLVESYKQQGYQIIVISASYDFIVEKIAKEIKADKFLSTTLQRDGEYLTGKVLEDLLKIKHKKFLEQKFDYEEVILITDNVTDYQLACYAHKSHIILNNKNFDFWTKKKSEKMELLEVEQCI